MRRDSRGIGGGIVREKKQEEERREVQRNKEGEILLGAILPY
jgi:hypothetical protein